MMLIENEERATTFNFRGGDRSTTHVIMKERKIDLLVSIDHSLVLFIN